MISTKHIDSSSINTQSAQIGSRYFFMVILFFVISPLFAQSNLYDDMSIEELMNVQVITSGKIPEKVNEVPASVKVITREEIEAYGYRSLKEILEYVPGFYAINDLAYQPNFGVRGFLNYIPNRNMIFMINGVSQKNDIEGSNRMETFEIPVEAIDKIEVIRGPMSVMYGSGGFFGAINIFTNVIPDDGQFFDLSLNYGTGNIYKFTGHSSGKQNDFSYSMSLAYMYNYGLDEVYSKMGSTGDILGNGSEQKSGGRFEHNNFHFDSWASFKNLWAYFSYDRTNREIAFLLQPLKDGIGTFEFIHSTRVAVGYKTDLFDFLDIDFKINFNHVSDNFEFEVLPDKYEVQNHPASSLIAEANLFFHPGKNVDITTGLNISSIYDAYNSYDLPEFSLPNTIISTDGDPIITQAAYVQAKWRIIDPLIIVGGLRLERQLKHKLLSEEAASTPDYRKTEDIYSQDNAVVVPRLAAIYSLNENNVIKLLYGEAINHPSFFEKADMVADPRPQIRYEQIHTFEINYNGILSSNLSLSASLFHNVFIDLLIRETGFDNNADYYSYWKNSGELTSTGFEGQIKFEPFENTTIDLAVTYQSTVDQLNKEVTVPYSPKLLAYLKTYFRFNKNITAGIITNFVDEMYAQYDTTPVDITNPLSPPIGRIGRKVNNYINFSFNIRANDIFWDNSYLNLHINNIFDNDIFSPTTQNSIWAPHGTLHGGRSFYLTIGTFINSGQN